VNVWRVGMSCFVHKRSVWCHRVTTAAYGRGPVSRRGMTDTASASAMLIGLDLDEGDD
jgi:hypothetical protein